MHEGESLLTPEKCTSVPKSIGDVEGQRNFSFLVLPREEVTPSDTMESRPQLGQLNAQVHSSP